MKKFFILCIGVLYSVACMANEIPMKLVLLPISDDSFSAN